MLISLINILLVSILGFIPSASLSCDGYPLVVQIINNQNGDFTIIKDLEERDSGSFVVINWREKLMLPRTFINNEISFSDRKWKLIYENSEDARIINAKPNGQVITYNCQSSD